MGIFTVTTHLYDWVRSLPLDIALYQYVASLPNGKEDKNFITKPELALSLMKFGITGTEELILHS